MFSFLHQYSNNDDDDDGDDDDVLITSQETERWETKHFIGMAKLSLLQEPMGSWFALIFFALLSIFVRIKKCVGGIDRFLNTLQTRALILSFIMISNM